jgi:hypothetical protein
LVNWFARLRKQGERCAIVVRANSCSNFRFKPRHGLGECPLGGFDEACCLGLRRGLCA